MGERATILKSCTKILICERNRPDCENGLENTGYMRSSYDKRSSRYDKFEKYMRYSLRRLHNRLDQCRLIELPRVHDPRGNLSFIEGQNHVPFDIQRVYYLYDVPGGAERGGHAHKALHQLLIATSGSFDVVLDDGLAKKRINLNRPYIGLYISPMIWRELDNFASGSVCVVLASNRYDESDYFRNYDDFMASVERRS